MPITSQHKLHEEEEDMRQIKKIVHGNILVTTLCPVADPDLNPRQGRWGRKWRFVFAFLPSTIFYFLPEIRGGGEAIPPAPPLDPLLMPPPPVVATGKTIHVLRW